ncbi:hypothetical protein Tco_0212755 [Tanacetum coccineum]
MSTQQDIYVAGSENRPPMLNKDNYVPWSSRLLRYAKSKPNVKLIYNSIMNGPYVRRMIPKPGDPDRKVPVAETFHEQTDDELTKKEVKQMEADDQAIQIILMGLPKDIYAAVDSCIQTKLLNTNQQKPENFIKPTQQADYTTGYEYGSRQTDANGWRNGGNQFRQYVGQEDGNQKGYNALHNVRNQVVQNTVQNSGVQNVRNQNGLIVVLGIVNQNPNRNGNVVVARDEGNANGNNGNQIMCYNCRGLGHLARNYTVRPRKRDVAFLQTQLQIAQKEEAGIQLQAEEFDFMAAAGDLEDIEEVNANCILMANLQQASTSSTQTDSAPVYDSDGLTKVHKYDNSYNKEIFNMFTQEDHVEQSGGTVEQNPTTVEETHAYFESLYNNLAIEVEKVNTVNRKLRETNTDLTTELARYKNQEKHFEISQEKYDKLESVIKSLFIKSNLSKEKSTVSSFQEEKKKLKSDFKIHEDELLDKQIQLENKINELDNILVKTGQSIQTMYMLSPKPDSFYHTELKMALGYQNPFYLKQAQQKQQSLHNGKVLLEKHDPPAVYDSEEILQLAQESRLKMKQLNKEIKPANYAKINHLSG